MRRKGLEPGPEKNPTEGEGVIHVPFSGATDPVPGAGQIMVAGKQERKDVTYQERKIQIF